MYAALSRQLHDLSDHNCLARSCKIAYLWKQPYLGWDIPIELFESAAQQSDVKIEWL